MLFEEKEKEIQELLGISLDTILYSKWYWSEYFVTRLEKNRRRRLSEYGRLSDEGF